MLNAASAGLTKGWGSMVPNFIFRGILILSLMLCVQSIQKAHDVNRSTQSFRFTIPAQYLKHLTLGFSPLVADMLWLRLVQEIDYKEKTSNKENTASGWVYQMLDGITTLDPRYLIAYRAGITVLSVVIQDPQGAGALYDRGIQNFPNDWSLLYRAGYHYMYEMGDCQKAAETLIKASQAGAPQWIGALAGKLYLATGQYDLAESVLKDGLERFKDTPVADRFKQRLTLLEEARKSGKKIDLKVPCR